MDSITIQLSDVMEQLDATLVATIEEVTTEDFTDEVRERVRAYLLKALQTSSYGAYVNAICMGFSEQIIDQLKK
ncbi:hypothetical protein [Candidatus Enterococcus clewellii]|uniref:Uncharacterized protein n=1 Tax=Candidatus Enterococcus clewellii TaxID=1834193 RepID=A0A242K4W0_9ENTE|nr:hypothetical protein [Enterococcus sp. 9E7_DIV0242]OTP13414.1 hypothetical protein A5888_002892 [Enterococcus sp. 9E7_DIV0242]